MLDAIVRISLRYRLLVIVGFVILIGLGIRAWILLRSMRSNQVHEVLRAALVGHVHHVDAGERLEQFSGEVRRAADAGRRVTELARFRPSNVD